LPGIAMMIRGQFRPLAKKELLKIPVFGWVTKATCVVVDRGDSASRKKSINFLKKILGYNISILIFPEGTQNRTAELLQPFKDGAFRVAVDTQQSILPLAVIGAGPLMPPGTVNMKPGKIKIVVGEEIKVTAESDISALKEKALQQIKGMLTEGSR
jgi:1-acyl-sn-glycerol-3-phosphate acyltransferase